MYELIFQLGEVIILALKAQMYSENGVILSKKELKLGDKVLLSYDGLLVKSGADQVIAHIGYGDMWDEKAFIPMDAEDGVFTATFIVGQAKDLNISFKDGADNWDNNSNLNYTFTVNEKVKEPKKTESVKKAKAEAEAEAEATKKVAKIAAKTATKSTVKTKKGETKT
jgi:hypothetical protein